VACTRHAAPVMRERISFTLDGRAVEAMPDETIWQVAAREGVGIPHLCYTPEPGYRPDGNCRACMVQVEGERVLAASCLRRPMDGMVVDTQTERATKARNMVLELLVADQPDRATAHDADSKFWQWADHTGMIESRFPARNSPAADTSHSAMAVNLGACIHCKSFSISMTRWDNLPAWPVANVCRPAPPAHCCRPP